MEYKMQCNYFQKVMALRLKTYDFRKLGNLSEKK